MISRDVEERAMFKNIFTKEIPSCVTFPSGTYERRPEIDCRLECVSNLVTYGRRNIIHTPCWPGQRAANRNANYLCDQASMALSTMNGNGNCFKTAYGSKVISIFTLHGGHTIHSIHHGQQPVWAQKIVNIKIQPFVEYTSFFSVSAIRGICNKVVVKKTTSKLHALKNQLAYLPRVCAILMIYVPFAML